MSFWQSRTAAAFGLACAAALVVSGGAGAENYPAKPITIIVPFAGGGGADVVLRQVGEQLRERWGQPVIIDNRPGGNGIIGVRAAAQTAPDGYTFLFVTEQAVASNPSLYRSLPYDPNKDFTPVTLLVKAGLVLVLNPSVPAKTLKELVSLGKTSSNLSYASTGVGTAPHLNMELFKSQIGADILHVPFNGGARASTAVLGGHVSMSLLGLSVTKPQIEAGTLRPILVGGDGRSPFLPDVPTFAENGMKFLPSWMALLAPAGAPKDILVKVSSEISDIMRIPGIRTRFEGLGYQVVGNSPDEFGAFMKEEQKRWGEAVSIAGARLE